MSELVRTFLVAPLPQQTGPLFRMLQKSASKGSVPSPRGAARWRPLFPSRTLGHLRLSQLARSVVGPSLTSGADANCNCEIELRPCVCARARACQERCQWHDVGATIITPNYGGFKKRTGFNFGGYTESKFDEPN
jgi:hypothetical protein